MKGYRDSQVTGDQVIISTIEKNEDVLVYLCSVAERIIFRKKITERTENNCEPRVKEIQLQRQKMVAGFTSFFI